MKTNCKCEQMVKTDFYQWHPQNTSQLLIGELLCNWVTRVVYDRKVKNLSATFQIYNIYMYITAVKTVKNTAGKQTRPFCFEYDAWRVANRNRFVKKWSYRWRLPVILRFTCIKSKNIGDKLKAACCDQRDSSGPREKPRNKQHGVTSFSGKLRARLQSPTTNLSSWNQWERSVTRFATICLMFSSYSLVICSLDRSTRTFFCGFTTRVPCCAYSSRTSCSERRFFLTLVVSTWRDGFIKREEYVTCLSSSCMLNQGWKQQRNDSKMEWTEQKLKENSTKTKTQKEIN